MKQILIICALSSVLSCALETRKETPASIISCERYTVTWQDTTFHYKVLLPDSTVTGYSSRLRLNKGEKVKLIIYQ